MSGPILDLSAFVPGGLLATDHVHSTECRGRQRAYDQTCSRCRRRIPDEAACPLMIWRPEGGMLAYCEGCQEGVS